ncbi:Bacterial regulatory protein, MarR [mine drainage metagenome]|uniref:Bacterial regulatory protein, MarR n=1 Tax=mine drainage metagenome TaxID=410659 RepID=T1AAS5_9ZZZZ
MNPVCNLPVGAEENLGLLLGLARARIISALEAELAANGLAINHTQYAALKRLAQCGPLAPGELAQALGHDAGAMTRVLDGLEEKGYVRRAPNPDDRRCVRVTPHRGRHRAVVAHARLRRTHPGARAARSERNRARRVA